MSTPTLLSIICQNKKQGFQFLERVHINALILGIDFEKGYGKAAHTILNSCDTVVFMGTNSLSDAEYFAKRAKPIQDMLKLPLFSSFIFRCSEKPRLVRSINPDEWRRDMMRKTSFEAWSPI